MLSKTLCKAFTTVQTLINEFMTHILASYLNDKKDEYIVCDRLAVLFEKKMARFTSQ